MKSKETRQKPSLQKLSLHQYAGTFIGFTFVFVILLLEHGAKFQQFAANIGNTKIFYYNHTEMNATNIGNNHKILRTYCV